MKLVSWIPHGESSLGNRDMNAASQPLVSIVTPVYNGAQYLSECIESILAQTYTNWDYTIVNNCSTDGSLAIAQKYAASDPRIRVVSNDRFLRIIENHNHTIREISRDSKYCKFVFADDWLYPNCIEEMVGVAEKNPSAEVDTSNAPGTKRRLTPQQTCEKFWTLPHRNQFKQVNRPNRMWIRG